LSRAVGLQAVDPGPEIGEGNARAAPVSAVPRKDGVRLRAGPEVARIVPREPLDPRDQPGSPTGMAPRTRGDLRASEALRVTRTRLTNAVLAVAQPRRAVTRADRAALRVAKNEAQTPDGPEGVLERRARIAWRHLR